MSSTPAMGIPKSLRQTAQEYIKSVRAFEALKLEGVLIAIDGRGFCICAVHKPVAQFVRLAVGLPLLPVLPMRLATEKEVKVAIKAGYHIPHIAAQRVSNVIY